MNNFIIRAELDAQSTSVRKNRSIFEQLARLRVELVDQAYLLEHRGRRDAADLAIMISARVGELCDDHEAARLDSDSCGEPDRRGSRSLLAGDERGLRR